MCQRKEVHDVQQYLNSIDIQKLKGLQHVMVDFTTSRVTGLFGKNGSGKTTLLHAILCLYRSSHHEEWKLTRMSQYFKYTDSNLWIGSEYNATFAYFDANKKEVTVSKPRPYHKRKSKWYPPQLRKPERPIYYLPIYTCVPDIEKFNSTTVTFVPRNVKHVDHEAEIAAKASYILGYRYSELEENYIWKAHCMRTAREDGLTYHSFCMGAGEQRLFRILNTLYNAEKYSLILIDEIDLTLHTAALMRLIEVMVEVAQSNKLQIIFTSHRQELLDVETINRYYLMPNMGGDTIVLSNPTADCYDDLTGVNSQPLTIFVEDKFSRVIVKHFLQTKRVSKRVSIRTFGGSQNACAIAAAICKMCTEKEKQKNYLIVTDGDVEDMLGDGGKVKQMKKYFGGNLTVDIEHREQAARLITEFCPNKASSRLTCNSNEHLLHPEEYVYESIYQLITSNFAELKRASDSIVGLSEHHQYVSKMLELDYSLDEIISVFMENKEAWVNYLKNIEAWLDERISALGIGSLMNA